MKSPKEDAPARPDRRKALNCLAAWTGDALMDLLEDRGFSVETRVLDAVGVFRATRR